MKRYAKPIKIDPINIKNTFLFGMIVFMLSLEACIAPQTPTSPTIPTTALAGPTVIQTDQPLSEIPTLSPATAFENTVYVALNGSDENGDGSRERPWATITHALDSVSDNSLILVRPGLYEGRIRIRGQFSQGVAVRSEVPYQAKLRSLESVLTIFDAQGITIEGFDIAHTGPGAEPIVVHIQDDMGAEPGGAEFTSRVTLRDNIIHDSYNNDLLKINNGAQQITISGNLFYNQGDSDEHIDINSVRDVIIEDNIFMSDFPGSGREISGQASSYIVVKDSNGEEDGILGSENITIRRNVFLHYEGSPGTNFILLGEDGNPYYEAQNVNIENNLFLGDSSVPIRSPLGCKGVANVTFRFNTISGDLPGSAFAMRLNVEGNNQPNQDILFTNNIWVDPTGTMERFATAPADESQNITLRHNLYWNAGRDLPTSADEAINISLDPSPVIANPYLPALTGLILPRYEDGFADGSTSIRQAFEALVRRYGVPASGSVAIDAADPSQAISEDVLGQPRSAKADIGAYEVQGNEASSAAPQATQPPAATSAPLAAGGLVTYQFNDRLYLIEARENATPRDVSAALDAFSAGKDEWLNLSSDGDWLLVSSERADSRCQGWACLHIAPSDLSRLEVVLVNGEPLHPDYSVAASGGNLLILTQNGGPHSRDLWATKRQSDGWSQPVLLTAASPYDYNMLPSISNDGARLVFTCSPDPYGQEGSAICEVDTDGNGFRVVLTPENGPGGSASNSLREPAYGLDGSIVFEADWGGERIWRLLPGSSQPNLVNAEMGNDNSPCVLPNGNIVSLWLARPGSSGVHELKVMSADGSSYFMIISGQDISDTGISCGQ